LQATGYQTILNIQTGNNPPSANINLTPFYAAGYIQDEWKPSLFTTDPLAITAGLRVDKISSNSEVGIDPRISARYILNPSISLKASYGIYHQYLKLASNPFIPVFDVWSPTDAIQPPERADQYVLGISTIPFEDYTFDVEGYYKNMKNLVEMKPNVRSGATLEDIFFVGNGSAYGIEFFLQKQVGRLTGWIGYTLAWTWRTFPDINNGNAFPPTYDRRNDFDIVLTYVLNDRWTLGGTFTYGTGQAYTQITALAPNYENPTSTIPIEGDKIHFGCRPIIEWIFLQPIISVSFRISAMQNSILIFSMPIIIAMSGFRKWINQPIPRRFHISGYCLFCRRLVYQ